MYYTRILHTLKTWKQNLNIKKDPPDKILSLFGIQNMSLWAHESFASAQCESIRMSSKRCQFNSLYKFFSSTS